MTPVLEHPASLHDLELARRSAAEHRSVLRRVRLFSLAAYLAGVCVYALAREWKSLLGLTCSAAVIMINFLWLEDIVVRVLQPTPRLKAWRLAVRTLARFALFGAAFSIAIFVARFDALSVLLGFSVLVLGILMEAVYSSVSSLRS